MQTDIKRMNLCCATFFPMQTFNHFWALWKHRILSWDLKEAAWHPGEVAGTRDSWEVAVRVGDGGPGGEESGEKCLKK